MNTLVQFMGVYENDRLNFWDENSKPLLRLDWKAELKYIFSIFSLLKSNGLTFLLDDSRIEIEEVGSIPMSEVFLATVGDMDECFDAENLVFHLACKDENDHRFEILFHFTQFLRLDRPYNTDANLNRLSDEEEWNSRNADANLNRLIAEEERNPRNAEAKLNRLIAKAKATSLTFEAELNRLIEEAKLKPTICLEVQICSDNSSLSVENLPAKGEKTLLEKIKFALSNQMKEDWKKVIWMLDKESDVLSESLYLDFLHFETSLRQAVAYLMSRFFDPSDTMGNREHGNGDGDGDVQELADFDNIDTRFFTEFGNLQQYIAGLLGKEANKIQKQGKQMGEQVRYIYVPSKDKDNKDKAFGPVRKWVERYFCETGSPSDKISVEEISNIRESRNKIAHYAPITNAYYHQQKQQLEQLNRKLSEIIERIERDNVSAAQSEQGVLDAALLWPMLKE